MRMYPVIRLVLVMSMLPVGAISLRHAEAQQTRQSSSCAPAVTAGNTSSSRLVAGSNDFGFRLLNSVMSPGENAFISPASVAFALDMAYDGSRASTAQGMARALGIQGLSRSSVRAQAASLLHQLQTSGNGTGLSIANSLWARKGVRFRAPFLRNAARDYGAVTRTLDFTSPAAPATINTWVSCATQGKIPTIIDRIPPNIALYLLNAVYFHGDWAAQFNAANTRSQPFTTGDQRHVQVPLMSRTGSYAYYKDASIQAIRLPYAGNRFGMVIVEPSGSAGALEGRMTAARWKQWTAKMRPMSGSISIPRFSLKNTFQLNGPLSGLGMTQAFTTSANFRGMCIPNCRISEVRHKTFLAVNEKGTVAGAVTSVGMEPTAIPQIQFQMIVNHPFFVSIEDSQTGAILFTGYVADPTQ